jgi:hypothetical protein
MMAIRFQCPRQLYGIIPEPTIAAHRLPDWLREMQASAPNPEPSKELPTAKKCPPFVDLLLTGFYFLLSADIIFDGMEFRWDAPELINELAPYPAGPMSFHLASQLSGVPIAEGASRVIKFHNFWSVELEAGWSLLFLHPPHQNRSPFQTISAIVDADRYKGTFIQIPAVWHSAQACTLKRGTPIAHCIPIKREKLAVISEPMSDKEQIRFEENVQNLLQTPGIYRRQFRADREF